MRTIFLVDGFVAGTWQVEKSRRSATLVIEPFQGLSEETRAALIKEDQQLVRFVEEKATTTQVEFAEG